jgi:hypothetical protein
MKSDRFKVGATVVVNGNGCYNGEGVPVAFDGRKAKILKVGRTKLKVLFDGEPVGRNIRMTDVRRVVKR